MIRVHNDEARARHEKETLKQSKADGPEYIEIATKAAKEQTESFAEPLEDDSLHIGKFVNRS